MSGVESVDKYAWSSINQNKLSVITGLNANGLIFRFFIVSSVFSKSGLSVVLMNPKDFLSLSSSFMDRKALRYFV